MCYFSFSFWSLSISLLAAIYMFLMWDFPLSSDDGKKWISTVSELVLLSPCFHCLSTLLLPTPFRVNCCEGSFSVPVLHFFSITASLAPFLVLSSLQVTFFGLCTFLSFFLSFSLSLLQLLLFLPYMVVSPDVVTAHFWTSRFGCNVERTITLTKYIWRQSLRYKCVPKLIRYSRELERLLNEHQTDHYSTFTC